MGLLCPWYGPATVPGLRVVNAVRTTEEVVLSVKHPLPQMGVGLVDLY